MTKWTGLWGFSWRDIAPALLLFFVMVWVYNWWEQHERDREPVEAYFEITQLAVPDHFHGEDPKIVYERTIHKPFRGEWVASIDVVGTLSSMCANSRKVDYAPERKLPTGGPTLSWFMGRDCYLRPGNYRLSVCWEVERDRAVPVKFCKYTEPFTVREKEDNAG